LHSVSLTPINQIRRQLGNLMSMFEEARAISASVSRRACPHLGYQMPATIRSASIGAESAVRLSGDPAPGTGPCFICPNLSLRWRLSVGPGPPRLEPAWIELVGSLPGSRRQASGEAGGRR